MTTAQFYKFDKPYGSLNRIVSLRSHQIFHFACGITINPDLIQLVWMYIWRVPVYLFGKYENLFEFLSRKGMYIYIYQPAQTLLCNQVALRDWIHETKGLIIYVLHEFSTCDSFLNNFQSIYPCLRRRLYNLASPCVYIYIHTYTCACVCVCVCVCMIHIIYIYKIHIDMTMHTHIYAHCTRYLYLKYLIVNSIGRTRFRLAIRLTR